jgi:hypothetical protein
MPLMLIAIGKNCCIKRVSNSGGITPSNRIKAAAIIDPVDKSMSYARSNNFFGE